MFPFRCDFVFVATLSGALFTIAQGRLLAEEARETNASSVAGVDFEQEIQPLLRKHCYQCHGRDVQEGGLRLDQKQHALGGGGGGKVILPGRPEDSPLLLLVSGEDPDGRVMPPEDEAPPLRDAQVAAIRRWIEAGADWPDGVDPVETERQTPWSFAPIERPAIPPVGDESWVRNPIDSFLLARLEAADMRPAPPTTGNALARRAALDLTGLPLTLEELEQFEHESLLDPDAAFADLVQRLLDSPHYGERWGRHWLDLARYADSNGYEVDGEKPLAWKYRDYVIKSFNDDKPYDRFVLEQLAGDELADASPETVIATGFLRVGPWDAERGASVQPSEVVAERYNELDDMVRTTAQVFLGMTLGCARCHDHKFDPLASRDYYSMVAVFNPLTRHKNGRTELTRPAVPPPGLAEKHQADQRVAELQARVRELDVPLRTGLLESGITKLPADAVAALQVPADERDDAQKQLVARSTPAFDAEIDKALTNAETAGRFLAPEVLEEINEVRAEIVRLKAEFQYPEGYFFYEPSPEAPVTHLLKRGSPAQPGPVVDPAAPAAIVEEAGLPEPVFESPDNLTSRRRISAARWIVNEDNPLTSRVIVNRIWQLHFGTGLVRTPNDFGNRGALPTHPQLLDWLAHWFVHDADWSLKKLHVLIMSSSAYRMSKQSNPAYAALDPDNRLWWRFPYRRLEVEAIRDAMLAASGQLNRQLYGPPMYPRIPEAALRSGYNPESVWKPFDERDASRRTVYAYLKRTLVVPFLETLDFCDTTQSAARRDITTVAPQALELLNGEFVNRQSRHFADRLDREAGGELPQQIEHAYRLALGRSARADEVGALSAFVQQEEALTAGEYGAGQNLTNDEARRQALAQMCRVIFNLNEFVYTD